ncbi:MAG: histidine phosphatase family protein [Alphaproteobacteria bacterium]|nr:histidine phosphatase family protein [Alphaproteobacteria bacterium]
MPHLLLVRHGNTFESNQTPTFVGGKTDMKLTNTGEDQARVFAEMVASRYAPLSGIICGPLQRTQRFAEIIAAQTHQIFTVDERLCEIDYGLWENKTSADVRAAYGDSVVEAWEQDGIWPEDMNWAPSLQKLQRNVSTLMAEQHKKLIMLGAHDRVIVTSNGILRFVYSHITGKPADKEAKVGTGRYCLLETTTEGWTLQGWNQKPDTP